MSKNTPTRTSSVPKKARRVIVSLGSLVADGILYIGAESLSGFDSLGTILTAVAADEQIPGPMKILIDARGTDIVPDYQEIADVAHLVTVNMSRFGPRAAIAVSDELHHGLARVGAAYGTAAGLETNVFFDVREALRWLKEC